MIRKTLTVALAVAAMMAATLAFNTTQADAIDGEPTCPYYFVAVTDNGNFVLGDAEDEIEGFKAVNPATGNDLSCADSATYTGPFTNAPAAPTGPYGWGSLNVVAGAAPEAAAPAAGGTGGGLAHTGSESTAIAFIGSGLIAFGAVALGSRRKFF